MLGRCAPCLMEDVELRDRNLIPSWAYKRVRATGQKNPNPVSITRLSSCADLGPVVGVFSVRSIAKSGLVPAYCHRAVPAVRDFNAYVEGAKEGEDGRFRANKVESAVAMAKLFEKEDLTGILDLKTRLEEIVGQIRRWNKA